MGLGTRLTSTTHSNTLSTTIMSTETTTYLPSVTDVYYSTIMIEPTKTTINTDSQRLAAISTTPIDLSSVNTNPSSTSMYSITFRVQYPTNTEQGKTVDTKPSLSYNH